MTQSIKIRATGIAMNSSILQRFKSDSSGSVMLMFGLTVSVMVTAAGAALDYSRVSNIRSTMQGAIDAAILMAGKEYFDNGRKVSQDEFRQMAKANMRPDQKYLANTASVDFTTDKITASMNGNVANLFGSFIGVAESTVGVQSSVPIGANRLELALVLDSTASMGRLGKMDALKQAANELVDTLEADKKSGTNVAYAVVPFATQVRVSTGMAGADWIQFKSLEPDPRLNASPGSWDGCIMDRDKPHNTSKAKPASGRTDENHPAQNCTYSGLQDILPLTTNAATAKSKINSLTPDGNTNTTIGMAWGYNMITSGNPLGAAASSDTARTVKVIVFLTDGLNTEDRYGFSTTNIDADMRQLCASAKTRDVRVFTIRVIEGNDALLRDCATAPEDFFTTNDAAGIKTAFKTIGAKLMRLRLTS
jgi:Flp pilus assembly protein TadG